MEKRMQNQRGGMSTRRFLGMSLAFAAFLALVPLVPRVRAFTQGTVRLPPGSPAHYQVSSAAALVVCDVPSTLSLKKNSTNMAYAGFRCVNRYNKPITLNWSVIQDGGSGISAYGSGLLPATATVGCVNATFDTPNPKGNTGPFTMVLKGKTADTDEFYVELYFTATVGVGGGNNSGGCP
jgi:hypothetical protein